MNNRKDFLLPACYDLGMKKVHRGFIIRLVIVIVALVVIGGVYFERSRPQAATIPEMTSPFGTPGTSTVPIENKIQARTVIVGESKIYTNYTYGFSLSYPTDFSEEDFGDVLSVVEGRPEGTRLDFIRIGINVSSSTAGCIEDGFKDGAILANRIIGGVSFHAIEFKDSAAGGQRGNVTRFEAVRDGRCYRIEKYIAYHVPLERTEPSTYPSPFDEKTANSELDAIISSFKFIDWKTYTNKDYGFTLFYPQDWELDDRSSYMNGRQASVNLHSPERSDFPGHPGLPIYLLLPIAANADTKELNEAFSPCLATRDPKYTTGQSSCNAPVDRATEEAAPEQKIAAQIMSTFRFTGEKGKFATTSPSIRLIYPKGGEQWKWFGPNSVDWEPLGLKDSDEVKIAFRSSGGSVCWYKTEKPILAGKGSASYIIPSQVACDGDATGLKAGESYKVQIIVTKYDSGKGVADTSADYLTIVK